MHLSQLQDRVGKWHSKTFGDPPNILDLVADKIDEECTEFFQCQDCSNEIAGEELADTAIAILAYCSRRGIDLEAEILKKHCVNLKRVWRFEGGKFSRVKDS